MNVTIYEVHVWYATPDYEDNESTYYLNATEANKALRAANEMYTRNANKFYEFHAALFEHSSMTKNGEGEEYYSDSFLEDRGIYLSVDKVVNSYSEGDN